MLPLQGLIVAFRIYLHSIFAFELQHTNEPLFDLKCGMTMTTNMWQTAKPQCIWRCLQMESCLYINYNSVIEQCELGLSQCESLQPATGVMVQAFGPSRHDCLHWGSRGESGWVPIVAENGHFYVARTLHDEVLFIGTFKFGKFRAIDAGVMVETNHDIKFLTKNSSCSLPWMPYTADEPLPFGAVTGGHLADGSATFVARVHHDRFHFEYFHPKSAAVYYLHRGVQARTSMDLLILL